MSLDYVECSSCQSYWCAGGSRCPSFAGATAGSTSSRGSGKPPLFAPLPSVPERGELPPLRLTEDGTYSRGRFTAHRQAWPKGKPRDDCSYCEAKATMRCGMYCNMRLCDGHQIQCKCGAIICQDCVCDCTDADNTPLGPSSSGIPQHGGQSVTDTSVARAFAAGLVEEGMQRFMAGTYADMLEVQL